MWAEAQDRPAETGRRRAPARDAEVSATLPPSGNSVSAARRLVGAALETWDDDRLGWAAGLVVSELVTNALLHGLPPITVSVRRLPDGGVRIGVGDESPRMPVERHHGETATTGRGLHLVAALSAQTGVELTASGKLVWADVVDG